VKRQTPTLEEPFYTDGIGQRRCHFCLNLVSEGHAAACPTIAPRPEGAPDEEAEEAQEDRV
jgi:hypothetical protein